MRVERLLLGLALLGGCRVRSQTELDCLANDASVSPALCYARARVEGYDQGAAHGWVGYDDGYAQCESDRDTGDTEDTGDTGG